MKLFIAGLGLIGGSIALSLKNRFRDDVSIYAFDTDRDALDYALSRGIIDGASSVDFDNASGCDYVIISVHLDAYLEVSNRLVSVLGGKELVMDVGSVKNWVVENISPLFRKRSISFVPCHPIAGTEKRGVKNAVCGLFEGARCIITPHLNTDEEIDKAKSFWSMLGSHVEILDPIMHDVIFAKVSHIPHLIAYALVDYLLYEGKEYALRYAGGGFRDFTRIAASSARMWVNIFKLNKKEIIDDLSNFINTLQLYKNMMESDNWKEVESRLEKVSDIRKSLFNSI